MCVLSYDEIIEAVYGREMDIAPFRLEMVRPASYDVSLGSEFIWISGDGGGRKFWTGGVVELPPKQFILASLHEHVRLGSGIVGRIDGRSSIGRRGLFVQNAGFVDPGWDGVLTVELFNASDEVYPLVPGDPIAQICFMRMSRHPSVLYGDRRVGSRYQGATGVEASKLELNR